MNILPCPLQRNLQILLFPGFDQIGDPVQKDQVDDHYRKQDAYEVDQKKLIVQRNIIDEMSKSESFFLHGMHRLS
ncbi:hypothetical protein D3C75_1171520 [compost metagenome]